MSIRYVKGDDKFFVFNGKVEAWEGCALVKNPQLDWVLTNVAFGMNYYTAVEPDKVIEYALANGYRKEQ